MTKKSAGVKAPALLNSRLEEKALMRAMARMGNQTVREALLGTTLDEMIEEERAVLREEDRLARLDERLSAVRAKPQAGAEPAPATALATAMPKRQGGRTDLLTPLIGEAQDQCRDPWSASEVWPHLVRMAQDRRGPFIGVTDEGLKWVKANDEPDFFSIKALRGRLATARRKKSGKTR